MVNTESTPQGFGTANTGDGALPSKKFPLLLELPVAQGVEAVGGYGLEARGGRRLPGRDDFHRGRSRLAQPEVQRHPRPRGVGGPEDELLHLADAACGYAD